MPRAKPIIDRLTETTRNEVILSTRAAAVAIAELWDALRDAEGELGISITYDDDLISSLAGECSTPPSFNDLTKDNILESLREELRKER